MPTEPSTPPRNPAKRALGGGLIVLLFAVVVGGYFLYNMVPNLFHTALPKSDGVSGEWIGLVRYQADMLSNRDQPAAMKLTLSATDLTSIIPTYRMTGELRISGRSTPITLQADKLMTGHTMKSVNAQIDRSSDPAFQGGIITGDIRDGHLSMTLHSMAAASTASVEGTLEQGSDAQYNSLVRQLQ